MVIRVVQTGATWLTAIMMLIAGTPHFDCRCPNGSIKPFCLSLLSGKNGCCCEGSCCSAFLGDDTKGLATPESPSRTIPKKTCCCCQAHQENARDETQSAPLLSKACCEKTLAAAAIAVSAPSVKAPAQDLANHLFVLAPETTVAQEGFGTCDCSLINLCHWPPPADLVTVLQRFLI